jgi:hypothetical protein
MKPLNQSQRAFKADEVTYLDRKSIQLDRMLLRLFELLRFDGRPVVHRRRRTIEVDTLVEMMRGRPDRFPGFVDRPEVATAWLRSDLLQIMNRGKAGREVVVGPRPFHLNAYKLANPKAVQDYGASMQVWALLFHADPQLLGRLKEFFGKGLDRATDEYDGFTKLDLQTLAVLGLVDQVPIDHASTPVADPIAPVCLGQGRLMADDLRRLLAYEDVIPRHVLAGYIRTALGLHLALFVLRLFQLVPGWVECAQRRAERPACPVDQGATQDTTRCPYKLELVVDLTQDPSSPSAALARASTAAHLEGIARYTRAVILLNRLKDYASAGRTTAARSLADLLILLSEPQPDMDGFFKGRIADVRVQGPDEAEDPIVEAILGLDLSPLEKYVELVCRQRLGTERKNLEKMLDALVQKNRPGGFMRQPPGARSKRWFVLGSDLLETLVQIAVLDRQSEGIRSRNLLIDEFAEWLRTRYGFVIYAPGYREVPPEEQEAWRRNQAALRERLHQIGFFTDLSDAFNSQTIRPRYTVTSHA